MAIPRALRTLLASLPPGRRRVAEGLVQAEQAPTYGELAELLGLHQGTVYQHLRRLRRQHPEVYAALMAERGRQLAERHKRALARVEARSEAWHHEQAERRHFRRFGYYSWNAPLPAWGPGRMLAHDRPRGR